MLHKNRIAFNRSHLGWHTFLVLKHSKTNHVCVHPKIPVHLGNVRGHAVEDAADGGPVADF